MHEINNKIAKIIPSLRRYAYALAGTESGADQVVEGALERLLVNPNLQKEDLEGFGVQGCRIVWYETEQRREFDDVGPIERTRQSLQGIDSSHISRLLDDLPTAQRKCLIMSTVGDYSYNEISAMEYIPIAKVNGYISQARESFINRFFIDDVTLQEQETSLLEQYSDNHLNALLDNELDSSESARLRTALSLDEPLARRLELLALVDALIISNFGIIEDGPAIVPTHRINTAYLH